jgi:hypothetical protein
MVLGALRGDPAQDGVGVVDEHVDIPVLECVEVVTPGWCWVTRDRVAISHAFAPPVASGARCQCGAARLTLAGTVEEIDLSHELRAALPSFAEALAEPPHGRVGANAAVEEVVQQLYGGIEMCDCGHGRDEHSPTCMGLDGYGVRCVCPAFTDWTDQDED